MASRKYDGKVPGTVMLKGYAQEFQAFTILFDGNSTANMSHRHLVDLLAELRSRDVAKWWEVDPKFR